MHGRLGTLYLAQKLEIENKAEEAGLMRAPKRENTASNDLKMFIRLAFVVFGMIAAVTGVMTVAG